VQREERGSSGAAVAAVLACALVGALAGYAASYASHPEPSERAVAEPLAAFSPSIPTDPPIDVVPDSDRYLPLGTDLTYQRRFIGDASSRWGYDAPRGWERWVTESSGFRWTLPGNPDFTYSLRVAPITVPITTSNLARDRIAAVRGSEGVEDVQQESLTDDSVAFTYVSNSHARYQHSYWISLPGSEIGVFEITVSGRVRDEPGLESLLDHLVATTQHVG
jgi:hypothetical protein